MLIADIIFPEILKSSIFRSISVAIGIIFIVYGIVLNAVAGKTLKRFAHFDVKSGINKPDKMIDIGIFSCMRHPAMFGSIFFSVGLAFLSGKIMAILWSGWVSFIALYFIMAVEEKETLDSFGDEYCAFLRRTKPFSFSISCLIKGIKVLKVAKNADKLDL